MPAGRPTKYDPSICGDIPGMFANGKSKLGVAVELGIGMTTMHRWEEEHEEFRKAVLDGLELSQAWFENVALDHMVIEHQGDRLDTGLWKSNMANRFGWREKQDVTSDGKALPTGPMEVVVVKPEETEG